MYQKLLWQLEINKDQLVKILIKIPHSKSKYLYATNYSDDLRHLCKSDFGPWEFVSRSFFRSIASEFDLILDIWAYTGVYTVETAILNPNCIIHSFEPNPEIFRIFKKNIEINKLERHVKLCPIALGQQIGTSKLFLSKNTPTSMATLNTMQSEYLEVLIDTLDNIYLEKCIDLIKIDVKGFESEVFLGGKNTLERFKPIILAKALTQNELRKQQLVLTKYGYKNPIQVHPTSFSDSRNYIWFSKADEFKVNYYLSKARKEYIHFKT